MTQADTVESYTSHM